MNADTAISNLRFSAIDFGQDKLPALPWGKQRVSRQRRSAARALLEGARGLFNLRPAPFQKSFEAISLLGLTGGAMDSGAAAERIAHSAQAAVATAVAATGQPALSSADQDRLLVQAALHGDQSAFAELVTRYQQAVYNLAYRMLGDPSDAEDAAQEVFVRAWNQLHTFQMDRRFSTWLLSIASHHAIDVLRRRRPQAPLDDVALYVESDDPAPDEVVLEGEQRDLVKGLLNALPEKYRTVTVLRYYNGLSYDEIAQVTGLTESAVKTQLHRARRMLADMLLRRGESKREEL